MKAETRTWKPKGELDTPYKRAKQEWDERIGNSAVQARTWRLFAFATLFLVAMPAVGGMIWLGSLPKKVPYIVEVPATAAPSTGERPAGHGPNTNPPIRRSGTICNASFRIPA